MGYGGRTGGRGGGTVLHVRVCATAGPQQPRQQRQTAGTAWAPGAGSKQSAETESLFKERRILGWVRRRCCNMLVARGEESPVQGRGPLRGEGGRGRQHDVASCTSQGEQALVLGWREQPVARQPQSTDRLTVVTAAAAQSTWKKGCGSRRP